MEKGLKVIGITLIILLVIFAYLVNLVKVKTVRKYNYDINKGDKLIVKQDTYIFDDIEHIKLYDIGGIKKVEVSENKKVLEGDEVEVVFQDPDDDKYVKVKTKDNEGYMFSFVLSPNTQISYIEPYLAMLEDSDIFDMPNDDNKEILEGENLVKVYAKCDGFVLAKIASIKEEKICWVLEGKLSSYNSLKVNVGYVDKNAQIYYYNKKSSTYQEVNNNEEKENITESLVKQENINNKMVIIKTKTNDKYLVDIKDFYPITSPMEVD